ncbi:SMC-Scp complex subunit ScpB [Aurantiacibacter gangjinensis]|uniref:SMC-Scp complex subunit ScpB n=1 Tax=Aurantiacibacter gangjinensis TaxID=502682 RepID=UPI00090B7D62|nr:SMC-Scp complex subunit ScpB [Aurantiacibacter gangjinensis]APE27054.1 Segregation and condensation protein B [Aurantiacibacter gangjinensis]
MADAPDELVRAVEACLFAAEEPMTREQIAAHLGNADAGDIRTALGQLVADYDKRGVHLVERGKRWQFQTAPDLAHLLRREKDQLKRLSRAATEVLAIVAYHEPVSRAEIEAIRGVQTSGGTLDVLMEAGWVRIAGRREVPGRPVIYATTPEFLTHFGLESRKDLPGLAELKASGLLDPVEDAYEDLMTTRSDDTLEAASYSAETETGDESGEGMSHMDHGENAPIAAQETVETLAKPDESA